MEAVDAGTPRIPEVAAAGSSRSTARLLVVSIADKFGGAEIALADWIARSRASAPALRWCVLAAPGALVDRLRSLHWVEVILVGPGYRDFPATLRLARSLHRASPFAAALANGMRSAYLVRCLDLGIPRVAWVHMDLRLAAEHRFRAGLRTRVAAAVFSAYDRIVGVCRNNLQLLEAHGLGHCCSVVANGVDPATCLPRRGRTEVRRDLSVGEDAPLVLQVGRLEPGKHPELLVEALPLLPAATIAVFAGSGPLEPLLHARAAALGVAGRVRVLGQRRDVADLLGASDVLTLPSESEGMPLVLLEAMAAGVPVAATSVGGIPEIVSDGGNGLLVRERTAAGLAACIARLLADPGLRTRLAATAAERVRREHDPVRQARGLLAQVAAARQARRRSRRAVTVVTNMLPPYRVGLFERLARRFPLTVAVCQWREADRAWDRPEIAGRGFRVVPLPGVSLVRQTPDGPATKHLRLGVIPFLVARRPAVTVLGDASWTSWPALLGARLAGSRLVIWNERPWWSAPPPGWRRSLHQLLLRRAAAAVACGSDAARWLRLMGMPSERISTAVNCVDHHDFAGQARAPGSPLLITVSSLIPRKRVADLIGLLARPAMAAWRLDVVGSGPEEEGLREAARAAGVTGRIRWLGFLPPAGVADALAKATVLVLPTADDPWGLVINEAMAAGLPVIATERCGAALDLIRPDNGAVVPVGDLAAMERALLPLADGAERRSAMSAASLRRIATLSRDVEAAGFAAAIARAAERR